MLMRYAVTRSEQHLGPTTDSACLQEVKLAETPEEFHYWDGIAEVYGIIKTLDGLERVWMKDAVSDAEYTELCTKLLSQYKFILNDNVIVEGVPGNEMMRGFQNLESFTREWDVSIVKCAAA